MLIKPAITIVVLITILVDTGLNGELVSKSGTSASTPHVAGATALMVQAYRSGPQEVKEAFVKTAKGLGYDGNTQGAGMLDVDAAYLYLKDLHRPISQSVRPNGTAVYYTALANLGNINDTFNVSFTPVDFGARYEAYPGTVQPGWITMSSTGSACPGGMVNGSVSISVPADWSGMENATYTFVLTATSNTDGNATDNVTCLMVVNPTKRSMEEYTTLEVQWLSNQISSLQIDSDVKSSLLNKTATASQKNAQALSFLLAGGEMQSDNMLGAEYNVIDSLVSEINAQSGKGISTGDASALTAKAELIEGHINTAKVTPV